MPDGDHVRFLLSFLSDSPLVPQGEDGQGRERKGNRDRMTEVTDFGT